MCRIWLCCIVRDGTGVMRGGVARITDDREGRNGRDEQMI